MIQPLASTPARQPDEALAIKDAAQKFEALILEQMLKSAHPQASGPEGDARSLADQALARDIAKGSPFGLAKLLEGNPK